MTIRAVIFDMDGILIDSEPFWQDAEMAIFREVGIELSRNQCIQTMGLRIDEVVNYWHGKHPWNEPSKKFIEHAIIDKVIEMIHLKGEPKEGTEHTLDFFESKGVKLALASSSSYRLIDAVIEKMRLKGRFEVIYSAQDEEYGKPHPGVYITTAERMQVAPSECLAIEDSVNGVISAKAARMKCIAVPEPQARDDRRFGIADVVLDSLAKIDDEIWSKLNG